MKSIIILFLPFSFISYATVAAEKSDGFYGGLAAFNEKNGDHSGIEFTGLSNINKHFSAKISGVLYTGKSDSKINDLFGGFALTGYSHLSQPYINPHIGLGLFVGETFNCTDSEEEAEECREDIVLAMYPEFGIAFNIYNIQIYPFVRRYFDTNSKASTVNAYGIQVSYKL